MVLDISSLKPGDTIALRNEEELKTLLGALQGAGYLWRGGQKPLDWLPSIHETVMAISIQPYKRIIFWVSKRYLERIDKSSIYSFDDLIFYPPEPVIDLRGFLN